MSVVGQMPFGSFCSVRQPASLYPLAKCVSFPLPEFLWNSMGAGDVQTGLRINRLRTNGEYKATYWSVLRHRDLPTPTAL